MFFVERNLGRLSDATVQWQVVGLNASTQLDQTSGMLSFAVGQQYATITLRPIDDGNAPERSRRFVIALNSPTGGAIVPSASATAILTMASENDPHGVFSIEAVSNTPYDEPINGTVAVEFVIRRAGGTFGRVDVSYEAASGTATSGADFAAVSGVIQFAEGESARSVFVYVLPDTIPEVVETGYMLVTGASVVPADSEAPFGGGVISPRVAIGTGSVAAFSIVANDYANGVFQVMRVSPAAVQEGQVVAFIIQRAAGSFGTVDVRWTAPLSGNFTGGDVNVTVGEVRFLEGETVKPVWILVVDDTIPEIDETFSVVITLVSQIDPSLAAVGTRVIEGTPPVTVGGSDSVTFTILQNDDANGVFQFAAAARLLTADEPESGVAPVALLIERTAGAFGTASVQCRLMNLTNDMSALSSGGYQPLTAPVVFEEGVTTGACTFYVLADDIPEIQEMYSITLTGVSSNARIESGAASASTIIIRANDDPFGTFTFDARSVDVTEPTADEPSNSTATAPRRIRIVRTGGSFGMATVMYRTRILSGDDLLRDLTADPVFLDDPAPSNDSLLFRIYNAPVAGKLNVVPLIRNLNGTRGVQGCLLACALDARCVSVNVGVNGTAGQQNACDLLVVTSSSGVAVDAS